MATSTGGCRQTLIPNHADTVVVIGHAHRLATSVNIFAGQVQAAMFYLAAPIATTRRDAALVQTFSSWKQARHAATACKWPAGSSVQTFSTPRDKLPLWPAGESA
jgi:hypothetical protein